LQYKNLNFPWDIYIFFLVPFRIFITRKRLDKLGFNSIAKEWEKYAGVYNPDPVFISKLYKFHKVATFYLLKVFKDPNPCLIRSIILYQMCIKHKIQARLITGVQKTEGRLQGHSWLEICERPFNENKDYLNNFSIMLKV